MTTKCHEFGPARRVWAALPLAAALLAGCAPGGAAPTADDRDALPTVTVTAVPLEVRPIERFVYAVGTLDGFEEITLAPKAEGLVAAIHADVGDVVEPGGVLLEIDPTDFRLMADEARQGLVAELAKVGLTELPPEGFDVREVPFVRRAVVAEEDAARRLKLRRGLIGRNAVSRDEADLAETELKLAEAATAQAITEARAILAAARLRQASMATAEQRLADCQLRAPPPTGNSPPGFRYLVAQRLLSVGEMVRSMPVTTAYRLVAAHVLKLHAAVPERHTPDVKVGQAVEVRVEAYPDAVFTGTVARVNPTVDPANRTFQVEILVPNDDGRLRVGGFARAAIHVRTDPAVKAVPPQAVSTFAGVTKLFVAEGGLARAIPIQIGTRDRDWLEVIGDVPDNATIITSGLSQLVDGSPLRIRE